jgi:hypothetical protein
MYCLFDIFNGPYRPNELGENICVVHNPFAKNPLPPGFFPFGDEWRVEGENPKNIRGANPYRLVYSDLFENGNGPAC